MARQISGGSVTGGGLVSPLRIRLFRALWIVNLGANFGWLIQATAAGWLMTSLAGTPDLVALVQAAVQAPILCLSLLAGAAADVWDRRYVLLLAQCWMLAISVLLAFLTTIGAIEPWSLLVMTFALGLGAALQGPAFQAVIRELVPVEELPAAVTLNGIAFNFARAAAPAIAGMIIAASGAQAAFFVNAASYLGMIVVLATWRRPSPTDELPRERVGSAIVAGLRYGLQTPAIQNVLVRSAAFAFAAGAPLALLPLVARNLMDGGPLTYGILLGGFGAGAMVSAFFVHAARQRFGAERLVQGAAIGFTATLLILGSAREMWLLLPALALGGAAWLASFTSFNISVQTSSAFWVQARVFALYQTVMFGAMASGSWIWGEVAEQVGVPNALLLAGGWMAATLALSLRYRLASGPAPDLRPSRRRPDPVTAFILDEDEGPVLVTIEYRVSQQDARSFVRVMDEVGHLRRRNGATRWQLFQDVADAERWSEAFMVSSWLDYRRQARRATAADEAIEARALHYHKGEQQPVIRQMIARRFANERHLAPTAGKA
jgi:MFS family permease